MTLDELISQRWHEGWEPMYVLNALGEVTRPPKRGLWPDGMRVLLWRARFEARVLKVNGLKQAEAA